MKNKSIKIVSIVLMLLSLLSAGVPVCLGKGNNSNSITKNGKAVQFNYVNDSTIVSQIEDEIANDKELKNLKLEVNSNYGSVNLSGLVDTDAQFEKIIGIAYHNKWVKEVNSINLKVKNSNMPITDTIITAEIKGKLLRNKILDSNFANNVKVITKNKVVYLSGKVDNQKHKDDIIEIVKTVKNIKAIKHEGLSVDK